MAPAAVVAPFAGAWIETTDLQLLTYAYQSLPSRERGLKLSGGGGGGGTTVSLPSRERGLKPCCPYCG